ncbi:hypothetical protein HA050_01865 [Iodobacter sp. HSC-16F04]|uniref:Type I restriction modification DNA specificity domain-containing protein n=1 Tax=Iodobacter violaceini TaxID=3044271 RepID=A0ABX0KS12_9NEIS|nr:restriction endonuclease subunit S [Iodobacter violacea]NHQ84859.1 hypothetical protein [Iodobacter violacea]
MLPKEWKIKNLDSIFRVFDSLHQTPTFSNAGYPMVRVADVNGANLDLSNTAMVSVDVFMEFTKKYRPKRNDIVFSRVGSYGISAFVDTDEPFCLGQNTVIAESNDSADPKYVFYVLKSNYIKRQIERTVDGSSHKTVSLKVIRDLELPVPVLPEQKKIAQILSTWDQAIATTERLLDLARQQKKALMQQLLTGKKRLLSSDGQQFNGVWRYCTVNDFFKVGSSKRVLQEDWTDSGVPFYRTRELVSLSKNEPFRSEIYISEHLFDEITKKYETPSTGDFLVSGVGTLGICYQVKDGDRFYFKDGNVLWFKREGDIDSDFFYHCFQSDFIQKQITDQAAVTTVGTYTIQNAKKTKLYCPPTLEEQRKVAAVLNSAAQEIETLQSQLDGLKQEKKALMQTLLTGKRRVSVDE